jgi:hypothetical protein
MQQYSFFKEHSKIPRQAFLYTLERCGYRFCWGDAVHHIGGFGLQAHHHPGRVAVSISRNPERVTT